MTPVGGMLEVEPDHHRKEVARPFLGGKNGHLRGYKARAS